MTTRYTLNSTNNFKIINQSQLNRSKSKEAHSFSKSIRFTDPKINVKQMTYTRNIIQTPTNKGTGIGYGKRYDFQKNIVQSPASWKYKIKTYFEDVGQKKKGYSISMGRENITFGNYLDKERLHTPSATKYRNQKQSIKPKAPEFTIRKKTSFSQKKLIGQPLNFNPGPGSYQNNPQNYKSKGFASKFSNIAYGMNKTARFNSDATLSPGPFKYKVQKVDSSMNKTTNSKHKNMVNSIFGKTKKQSQFDNFAKISFKAGPGSYRLPSQFGIYEKISSRSPRKNSSRFLQY